MGDQDDRKLRQMVAHLDQRERERASADLERRSEDQGSRWLTLAIAFGVLSLFLPWFTGNEFDATSSIYFWARLLVGASVLAAAIRLFINESTAFDFLVGSVVAVACVVVLSWMVGTGDRVDIEPGAWLVLPAAATQLLAVRYFLETRQLIVRRKRRARAERREKQ